MSDSAEFSSLFALVDSHLAKVSLRDKAKENNTMIIPPLSSLPSGTVIPTPMTPSFGIGMGDVSIRNVLAEQVANMLKAKEKKKEEEERLRLEEEMKRLQIEEDNYVIDLTQAIIDPKDRIPPRPIEETKNISDSCEALFKLKFEEMLNEPKKSEPAEPPLPCIQGITYNLKQKIKRGKPSSFARVICAKWRPTPPPYIRKVIKTDIVRFDFSTPSPCDIIRENRRKPKMSNIAPLTIEDLLRMVE